MKFELHPPDAVKNFNEKADILLSELVPFSPKSFNTNKGSFRPNYPISSNFGKNDNRAVVKLIGYFKHNEQLIGLRKESHKKVEQLARDLQGKKALKEKVSIDLVTELIFSWMEKRYKNLTDSPFVDYVLVESEASIQDLEIWIPLAELYIQSEIKIGKITLKTIKKEMFERWRTVIKNANPADDDEIQAFDKEQNKIQGLAAATMKVNAEPIRAFEIALEETEKSIGLLRFFSPANFNPEITSYLTVLGKEKMEMTKHLILKNGDLVGISEAFVDKKISPWVMDDNQLSLFRQDGLDILSEILVQENRTDFQKKLLESLLLYSRSSLMVNLSDKLVYILVALESILLKDGKEPIQSKIADRMAIFIGINKQEKLSIVNNFIKAYGLRSSFIHHGYTVEDLETLKEFMLNTWMFFGQLIQNVLCGMINKK